MRKFRKGQIISWWSDQVGWKLYRVDHASDYDLIITNKSGSSKTVSLSAYGHRIRRFSMKMLLPWLLPIDRTGSKKRGPLTWNAPRRRA